MNHADYLMNKYAPKERDIREKGDFSAKSKRSHGSYHRPDNWSGKQQKVLMSKPFANLSL